MVDCRLLDPEAVPLDVLCRCVGAAESGSEHPLARAILEYCRWGARERGTGGHVAVPRRGAGGRSRFDKVAPR